MTRSLVLLAAALATAGCGRIIPRTAGPATPAAAPPPAVAAVATSAVGAGVSLAAMRVAVTDDGAARRALPAFVASCRALTARDDASGLTRREEWVPVCDAARATPPERATEFFGAAFEGVTVGDGAAFATGYYEPEIAGSRVPAPGFPVPIYRKPLDLVETTETRCPADFPAGAAPAIPPCKRVTLRGQSVGGVFQPYFDRGMIEDGALGGRGLELAWAADPIEFFFLQIQGSGRLRLPDGHVMRIGYDGQNGHEYTGIGRLLRERNVLGPGQATMQGISAWIRANPAEGKALMRENRSYVFFRELTGPGPVGSLGVPVTGRVTVAADPAFVPLGAPVILAMERAEASGLWIAQDTGGAIKGANRFDTFWGAGAEAETIAGGMSSRGTAVVLIPKASAARLGIAARP